MSAPFLRAPRVEGLLGAVARTEILSPVALRQVSRALSRDGVTSDALLQLADMAEEAAASLSLLPFYRRQYEQLARVLRLLAPAFADTPLPPPEQPAFPARALRQAADVLMHHGPAETVGVEAMLRRMAAAQEEAAP